MACILMQECLFELDIDIRIISIEQQVLETSPIGNVLRFHIAYIGGWPSDVAFFFFYLCKGVSV